MYPFTLLGTFLSVAYYAAGTSSASYVMAILGYGALWLPSIGLPSWAGLLVLFFVVFFCIAYNCGNYVDHLKDDFDRAMIAPHFAGITVIFLSYLTAHFMPAQQLSPWRDGVLLTSLVVLVLWPPTFAAFIHLQARIVERFMQALRI